MAGIKERKPKETKIDSQIKRYFPFLIGLGVLVLIFIILSYIFQGIGKINYEGLTFTKEKLGELIFYHYSYHVMSPAGKIYEYNLYLRNNPKTNSVPIEGEISYVPENMILIGINNTGLTECNQNTTLALAELSQFLTNNFLKVRGGYVDYNYSKTHNQTYISCELYPENTVIVMESGNETKVSRTGTNCYHVSSANCEVLQATEKFIVQSIIDAREATAAAEQ